jgi:hypothetical protein
MADVDLSILTVLYQERTQIEAAIENFDAGGTIASMTVTGGAPPPPPEPPPPPQEGEPPAPPPPPMPMPMMRMAVTVSTLNMTYPQQMIDAVKGQLTARRDKLNADIQTVLAGGSLDGTHAAAQSGPGTARQRPRSG